MSPDPRTILNDLFSAAVDAAKPDLCVPPHLPDAPTGRTIVIGAGKGAAAMAAAVEANWRGALEGLVVTRYGHGAPTKSIEVIEAAHPVPDAAGRAAAGRILENVQGLRPEDLVLCLISGGGSALLAMPANGLTLEDKQAVTGDLLRSGATISEINAVRKHLSAIKGGRLGAACHPARLVTLVISDVPGDDPAVIASGPTVPDPTTFADARGVLEKYGITGPAAVMKHLEAAAEESPKPGDARLAGSSLRMIATPAASLDAAASIAQANGLTPVILGDDLEGDARELAAEHARMAMESDTGIAILSGGETTVTVRGNGRGGRNAEYALGLAIALAGQAGIYGIACDTDGIDGTEDNAGAIVAPDTLTRAQAAGLDPEAMLADNDAYGFFERLGDLVMTGPTLTNVNDFRAIIV